VGGEHCQVNIGAALSHDVRLVSVLNIGPCAHLYAVVARVPASVVNVRGGWLDAR
jgi:hypothetical protein